MDIRRILPLLSLVLPLFAAAQPAWINDGLVAYYPFDGDAKDASGNGNHFVVENAPDFVDGFVSFNGVDEYLTRNRLTEGADYTWSLWVKLGTDNNSFPNTSVIVGQMDHSTHISPSLGILNGQPGETLLRYSVFPHGWTEGRHDLLNDNWHHLVVIFSSSGKNFLYANGVKLATFGTSGHRQGNPLFVLGGDRRHRPQRPLRYDVDNLRVYGRSLAPLEVSQLYEYESQPQPAADPRKATAVAQVVNGFIVGAEIVNGGYGYFSKPEVTISGGEGFGAVATATVSAGEVVKINIINSGFGYTGNPVIDIAAAPLPPAAAEATAQVVNGFVVGVDLTSGGEGYLEAPEVSVIGGNGFGAIAIAQVENGRVTGVQVINSGSGYTTTPAITIAPPKTAPRVSIRVTQVEVNLEVTVGKSYTIEASTNLADWVEASELFTAEEQFMALKFDVDEVGQFFRVVEQP